MGTKPVDDLKCWEIDSNGLIVKMLDHQLNRTKEDELLFHLKHCPDCLAIVADVLFTRSQVDERGPDYKVNVN